jgi:CRISPR/Cas system-associated protein Csm6
MSSRKKNPITEAAVYALGTAAGIVVGTVIATYIVESMRVNGAMSSSLPPAPTPATPQNYVLAGG